MEFIILVIIDFCFMLKIWSMMKKGQMRCHRKKERCLKVMRNKEWRICSRCLFINIGICTYPLVILVIKQHSITAGWLVSLGIAMQFPMLIDGVTQQLMKRTSNNVLRSITGLVSGIGLATGISFVLLIGGY